MRNFLCLLTLFSASSISIFGQAPDFSDLAPTPVSYPQEKVLDTYTTESFADTYAQRRAVWIDHVLANPDDGKYSQPYTQLMRLSEGKLPNEKGFVNAFKKAANREDCSDFQMQAVIRLMTEYGNSELVSDALKAHAKYTILNFKYWPDEPGVDHMCYWSENHFIMFAAAGYLAGQLYPDEVFVNSGRTGKEQMERFGPRIMKWMELRFKTGFSEWLSNVYFDEDFPPLLNIIALSKDEEMVARAKQIVDLMLVDMALNSYRGLFGSTHGRTYEPEKKWARRERTRSVTKLVFGTSEFSSSNMSAVQMALTPSYEPPRVVYEIYHDMTRNKMLNRQRVGWAVENAERWGLDPSNLDHLMYFLTQEAYSHWLVIGTFMQALTEWNWFQNEFFEGYAVKADRLRTLEENDLLQGFAWENRRDVNRGYRAEADICTYRTPSYMLSCVQDYRPGYGGDQQHVWQATLAPDAVCFTTHPVIDEVRAPNYWTGNGTLPRVGQIENVAIIVYNLDLSPGQYITHDCEFTHAWLPKDKFDEVVENECSNWIFARKGDSYLALWTQQRYSWQEKPGEDKDREIIVPGTQNIFICELGGKEENGSFAAFTEDILSARLLVDSLNAMYISPSQGLLEFGWTGKLRQNGNDIILGGHPRYSNPYAEIPYGGNVMRFECNDEWLELNWVTGTREASTFMKPRGRRQGD